MGGAAPLAPLAAHAAPDPRPPANPCPDQVVHGDGCYSNGRVTVAPLPAEVHGTTARLTWPLRRIEEVVAEAAAEEHCKRELAKVRRRRCRRHRCWLGRGHAGARQRAERCRAAVQAAGWSCC